MYLGEHPKTVPPECGKELTYFNLLYKEASIDFYISCWPKCEENGYMRYESSTDYIFEPKTPSRVKLWIPDCKFILLFRNPVRRAWSEYYNYWRPQFSVSIDEFKKLLEDVDYEAPEQLISPYTNKSKYRIVQKGIYVKGLKRWFGHFKREQFLIIRAEDFFVNPWAVVAKCVDFVGLEPYKLDVIRKYDILKAPDRSYPDMPEKLEAAYREYFKPHNEMLYDLLGRDFGW